MIYKIILILILIVVIIAGSMRAYNFFRRRKQRLAFNNAFRDFQGEKPKLKMYHSYGYPAFTITFKSNADMEKAEEDGTLMQFSNAIQEICGSPESKFDAERSISTTYEGRIITYS